MLSKESLNLSRESIVDSRDAQSHALDILYSYRL